MESGFESLPPSHCHPRRCPTRLPPASSGEGCGRQRLAARRRSARQDAQGARRGGWRFAESATEGVEDDAGGELGFADSSLTLTNADGTVDATNLDGLQLVPLDATTLAVTATATFRDGNSNPFRIAFVDLTLFDDGATLSVLDGSLSLTTP